MSTPNPRDKRGKSLLHLDGALWEANVGALDEVEETAPTVDKGGKLGR